MNTQFFSPLLQQRRPTLVVLLVTLLLLTYDFVSRVHVPKASWQTLTPSELQLTLNAAPAQALTATQSWLAQIAEAATAAEQAALSTTEQAAAPLTVTELAGASRLDDLQLRVRAIFISPGEQRLALLEVLAPDNQLSIIQLTEQQVLGAYTLSQITVQQLTFINTNAPDSAPISIPLFSVPDPML